jgi:hypothetical protein
MLIHLRPPPLFDENRDNRRRPIFWQRGLTRSKPDVAMRKSRQPLCAAAILLASASNNAKVLDTVRKFRSGDFSMALT